MTEKGTLFAMTEKGFLGITGTGGIIGNWMHSGGINRMTKEDGRILFLSF